MKPEEFKSYSTPHSYIWGERAGDYVHIKARVFNLCPGFLHEPWLEITSQGGGYSDATSLTLYGINHGMVSSTRSVMTLSEMEASLKVLRKIESRLRKNGYPNDNGDFASYASKVLLATGVKYHFVNQRFGEGFSGTITDTLPCFSDPIDLFKELQKLQEAAMDTLRELA